jgi:hypothetical protein
MQTVLHDVRSQTEETAENRASSMAYYKTWVSMVILSACDLTLLLGHGENLQRVLKYRCIESIHASKNEIACVSSVALSRHLLIFILFIPIIVN